jgi:Na+/phosphate symporter
MLQTSEIQKRFSHLQQTISEASRTCGANQSIPHDLKKCVEQLDSECQKAKSVMASQDQNKMRQCIDEMESISDRAEHACKTAGGLDAKVKQCVDTLHNELSDFKHQLH